RPPESFGEQGNLRAPAQDVAGEKGPQARWQLPHFTVEKHETILASGFAGRDETFAETQLLTQRYRGGIFVAGARGARLDAIAVPLDGVDDTAGARAALQKRHVAAALLKAIRQCQSPDAAANNHHIRHEPRSSTIPVRYRISAALWKTAGAIPSRRP